MDLKKSLVRTTALSAVALLSANAAMAAEKPKMRIYGYIETYAGGGEVEDGTVSNGTPTYNGGVQDGAFSMLQYGEVRFKMSGQTDSGMGWGAYIEFTANTDQQDEAKKTTTDEANVWIEGSWGKLEIGSQDGATDKMQIDSSELSLYDNRIVSAFADTRGVNLRGAEDQVTIGDTSDDNKLTYYTPRVNGFQAGVSYVPSGDTGDFETETTNNFTGAGNPRGTAPGDNQATYESGLSYKGKAGGAKFEVGGYYARTGEDKFDDEVDGFGAGAVVEYGPWAVTGGWSQNNNRRLANSEQTGYTAAVSYTGGPWTVTLLGLMSELEDESGALPDEEYQHVQLQGAYNLGGGLVLSAGAVWFDLESARVSGTVDEDGENIGKNNGWLGVVLLDASF